MTFVPVRHTTGAVDVDDVMAAITPNTMMISVMLANNETGVIQVMSISLMFVVFLYCVQTPPQYMYSKDLDLSVNGSNMCQMKNLINFRIGPYRQEAILRAPGNSVGSALDPRSRGPGFEIHAVDRGG